MKFIKFYFLKKTKLITTKIIIMSTKKNLIVIAGNAKQCKAQIYNHSSLKKVMEPILITVFKKKIGLLT